MRFPTEAEVRIIGSTSFCGTKRVLQEPKENNSEMSQMVQPCDEEGIGHMSGRSALRWTDACRRE